MSAHCCHDHHCAKTRTLDSPSWRRALWIALAVNAGMFLAEIIAGVAAGSVLSGLTPPPLADEGRPRHMAGPHGWVDGNAVHRVRVEGGDGAARAHGPGLPTLPLP